MDEEQLTWADLDLSLMETPDVTRRFEGLSKTWCGGIPTVPGFDMDAVYSKLILTHRELKRRGEAVKLPWA